ncbi:STAS domain-containing protein [bacterium]|nr:STAS domain-containing protein [bacterium]
MTNANEKEKKEPYGRTTSLSKDIETIVRVLNDAREGKLNVQLDENVLESKDDPAIHHLAQQINATLDMYSSQHIRVEEYHESTMEMAIGLSECFQVLAEVQHGNLNARVSDDTLNSKDELLQNLAKAINDTIRELEEHVSRQEVVIQELSTPILQIWDNILVLPVIGVVDTRRALEIMEKLLDDIIRKQSRYVILDITGVEVVDTKTADQFIKIIKAAELLGAKCVITGIRPAVAQTLVEIGVTLTGFLTLSNLKEGLKECLKLMEADKKSLKRN